MPSSDTAAALRAWREISHAAQQAEYLLAAAGLQWAKGDGPAPSPQLRQHVEYLRELANQYRDRALSQHP